MLLTVVVLVGSLALLAYAADQFVIGAARVALLWRIPPLVVGVVIVGFGTSLPEMLVSVLAASGGRVEIAVGNVLGSNIANLSLLLGVGATIVLLKVESRTVRREGLITIGAMALFGVVVQNGITTIEGAGLLGAMALVLLVVVRRAPTDPLAAEAEDLVEPGSGHPGVEVLRTILGLAGTVGAAQGLLWAATDLAERAGLAEGFVGVTLVAVGTSLPELVTVVQSARRGQTDLVVGNLLGSNLFNALAVGGAMGLVGAGNLDAPELTTVAAAAALLVAVVAVVSMRTGRGVTRREGLILIALYVGIVPLLA